MYFIKEAAYLQEAHIEKIHGNNKVTFVARLQKLNVPSLNNKKYLVAPMMEAIKAKEPLLKRNAFLGEMDHPIDPSLMRMITVLYKYASHLFKEIWLEGDTIYGLLENTSNQVGLDLYSFIVHDKIPVGFSLRALGDVRKENNCDVVFRNIEIITWDAVSNPAFSTCYLKEIVQPTQLESIKQLKTDLNYLEEYIHSTPEKQAQMILENKISPCMSKLVKRVENAFYADKKDLKAKFIFKSIEKMILKNL